VRDLVGAPPRLSREDLAQMAIRAGRMLRSRREWWRDGWASRPTLIESW
jgi:hypothetical protein